MTDDRLYQLIVKRHYELRSIDDKAKIDIDQMNRMVWMERYVPKLMISKHENQNITVFTIIKKFTIGIPTCARCTNSIYPCDRILFS